MEKEMPAYASKLSIVEEDEEEEGTAKADVEMIK